ncbi:type I restriction-modification system subunit M [Persicirhabdus sediminis]|uniref:site-specific DNA-methyltransferase (adenine-specific) n=1 Tax=Persicirhabdus sediminis TaxID=454144 RepID=A0A8J7SIB7_9BACT|nr:class I SAM-dependent DNA methyltransferase [Persicirhabdus sediminis]MBK1791355.1 SAM-dependent DNA methyltransferase [Persicirhabdus sediminis]
MPAKKSARKVATKAAKKAVKKKTAKKAAKKVVNKSFEESLWDTATKLRGSVESSEYKHVVLSLIFLKFVSDKFEERRAELVAEGKQDYLDMVEFYTMRNVFYLPETSRWSYIQQHAKQGDIAIKIDSALTDVEKSNASLKGALPDNYFSRLGLDGSKLSALIDAINNIDTVEDKEEDTVGRVYEYFLGKFAASEGKLGGEFYTPKCVVNLIAEMIEPYRGKIYDPCCGSGGMFVQSIKFVESHHGNKKDISVYGQEFTATTYKLAKMNLAVRGLSANLGEVPADTFFKDQHPDLKADYIMANPPFNLKDWRGPDELVNDGRWNGYETPPTGNANYAWILHMVSKLSENGVAGFVLANGSMSTSNKGEGEIRQKLVENDLVDCMIALPGQLFYTTQIPVCLWFLTKNKKADSERDYRNREGETLFIDARKIGSMISRTQKELSVEDIAQIAETYHSWRASTCANDELSMMSDELKTQHSELSTHHSTYEDVPGYCKSATLEHIRLHDYVLTPGRYVGAAALEDDGIPFETKMKDLSATLFSQMKEATALDQTIRQNLKSLGYEE